MMPRRIGRRERGVESLTFAPDWNQHGKAAGGHAPGSAHDGTRRLSAPPWLGEPMETTNRKLTNAVLFLLRGCGVTRPGVTTLLKMLFYADYWHYREHLRPITGAQYLAMERGPVLDGYKQLFGDMQDANLIAIEEVPIEGKPDPKQEFHAKAEWDEDIFTSSEVATLERVVEQCAHLTGRDLSERTHHEPAWILAWDKAPKTRIPYSTFRWFDNLPSEDQLKRAAARLHQRGLAKRVRELNAA